MSAALNPLPSFLRASAWDAGNMSMRKAGRTKWSEDDYNAAAETQNRLIKSCYGKESDHNEPNRCFIRFSIAEQMEREGLFKLDSNLPDIYAHIEAIMEQ